MSLALELVQSVLPPSTSCAVWEPMLGLELLGTEREQVARSVDSRKREFAQGRATARAALCALGREPVELPSGPDRAPVWPSGTVGSITHTDGLVAAAVAAASDWSGLGIDAEPRSALPADTVHAVLSEAERAHLHDVAAATDAPSEVLQRLVFSAKETVHKATFPGSGIWMDFLDVEIRLDPREGRFMVSASGAGPTPETLARLEGRFAMNTTHLVTGAVVAP